MRKEILRKARHLYGEGRKGGRLLKWAKRPVVKKGKDHSPQKSRIPYAWAFKNNNTTKEAEKQGGRANKSRLHF